jgi:UDP-2,3-diacylglucosamine hydrolase
MNAPPTMVNVSGEPVHAPNAQDLHRVLVHPAWRHADFISDIHLHPEAPATANAFIQYCHSSTAAAVFILGDLFEVWIGDDDLNLASPHAYPDNACDPRFEWRIVNALQQLRSRAAVYIMRGNRDFLLGTQFFRITGCQPLADPCTLISGTTRVLLSHGDAWCTEDHDYLRFRETARTQEWQHHFLALSRDERRTLASELRAHSAAKQAALLQHIDVDLKTIATNAYRESASVVIHGHTHRPESAPIAIASTDPLRTLCMRHVLPDWHFDGDAARAAQDPSLSRGHALRWSIPTGIWSRVSIVS